MPWNSAGLINIIRSECAEIHSNWTGRIRLLPLSISALGSVPVWSDARSVQTVESVPEAVGLGWSVFRHSEPPCVVDTTLALR